MAVRLGSKTLALAFLCLLAAHGAVEASRMGSGRKLSQVGAMGKATIPPFSPSVDMRSHKNNVLKTKASLYHLVACTAHVRGFKPPGHIWSGLLAHV